MTKRRPIESLPAEDVRIAAHMNQRAWTQCVGSFREAGRRRAVFLDHDVLAVRTGESGALMMPSGQNVPREALARAMTWLRRSGSGDVLVWSARSNSDLDRLLTTHGARDSFRPLWMSCRLDVATVPHTKSSVAQVRPVRLDDLPELLLRGDVPYHSRWHAHAIVHVSTQASPDRPMSMMVALVDDEIVGRGLVNLSTTAIGRVAGFYDVAVAPRWQRHGIGREMVHVLMRTAKEMGAEFGTLNATPVAESLYRDFGFREVGSGQTWVVPAHMLRQPPNDALVRFAMAISGGEVLDSSPPLERLADRELPNGDTPLAHAARFDQPKSARQLLSLGTIPDVAALWDMGLHDESRAMMTEPGALDTLRGSQQVAPIHVAIHWGDLDFVAALLDAGADPNVRDGTFDANAWGWCHALGNDDALARINERCTENH